MPKNELFTNCCFTKTVVNRPQIYFHVKKHCHLSSSDTFLPVSILQLYIPLHIGFTHILYIYICISLRTPHFATKKSTLSQHLRNSPFPTRLEVPAAMWPNGIDPVAQIHSRPSFWNEFAGAKFCDGPWPRTCFFSRMGSLH